MDFRQLATEMAAGAAAGAAATVPMSWSMELMHALLPAHQSHSLPPRKITERMTRRMGIHHHFNQEQRIWLALAAHLAYGAGVGAVYAPIADHVRLRPLWKGTIFGVLVWAGSYLGLLPALGLLEPATRHTARRNILMVAAHLIFGSALGMFEDAFEGRSRAEHPRFLGSGRSSFGRPVHA